MHKSRSQKTESGDRERCGRRRLELGSALQEVRLNAFGVVLHCEVNPNPGVGVLLDLPMRMELEMRRSGEVVFVGVDCRARCEG